MLKLDYREDPVTAVIYDQDPVIAVIYARVSSDAQDVNNSIEAQIAECQAFADQNNMIVIRTYIDEAETGRYDRRPHFQDMIADTVGETCPFRIILVWKFSRFSRAKLDNAFYKDRLKRRGVRILSIKEPVEDSPTGRLMESMIEGFDEYYSDNLSQEVIRGQRKVASRGFHPGNRAPYGYRLKKVQDVNDEAFHNIFVIDPVAAPIVRRIFREAIAGRSHRDIRHGLDADGIPPPEPMNKKHAKREKWADSTIFKIIHNKRYPGFIVWGENSKSGLPPIVVKGRHEPIVSEDEFDLAGRVAASNAHKVTHARQTSSEYMLSKMLKCRGCGATLIVRPSKNQTAAYYQSKTRRQEGVEVCDCPNLNIQKFDERFLKALFGDVLCPSNVQAAITQMKAETSGPYEEQHARLQAIENGLLEVQKKQARVMDAYEDGAYTVKQFNERSAPLRKNEAHLKQTRAEAASELDNEAAILAKPHEILQFVSQVADFMKHSPPKDRKQMLKRFVKCVWIEPGKATIVYRIPLPNDAKRPQATELVLALDEPVPPTVHVSPPTRGFSRMPKERRSRSLAVSPPTPPGWLSR